MKPFEILPHTADVRLKIYGASQEEVFKNALKGMAEILKPQIFDPASENWREIKIQSVDLAALLVDFLNEVLYLSGVNKEIYEEIDILSLTETEFKGKIKGRKIISFGEDIKAATYHENYFKQNPDSTWEALIIFDI